MRPTASTRHYSSRFELWSTYLGQWLRFRQWLYNKHAVPARYDPHSFEWVMAKDNPVPTLSEDAPINKSKALRQELTKKALLTLSQMRLVSGPAGPETVVSGDPARSTAGGRRHAEANSPKVPPKPILAGTGPVPFSVSRPGTGEEVRHDQPVDRPEHPER